jgi:hypothetical protein
MFVEIYRAFVVLRSLHVCFLAALNFLHLNFVHICTYMYL